MSFYPLYEYNEAINEDEEYDGELCDSCSIFNSCISLMKGRIPITDSCLFYKNEGGW